MTAGSEPKYIDPHSLGSHGLQIQLVGHSETPRFIVEPETSRRLGDVLETQKRGAEELLEFFTFDDLAGWTIHLSVEDIEFVRNTVEYGVAAEQIVDEVGELRIWFRGRDEPFTSIVRDPEDAYTVNFSTSMATEEEPFVAYFDEDGEKVTINLMHTVLIEIPTWLIEEAGNPDV